MKTQIGAGLGILTGAVIIGKSLLVGGILILLVGIGAWVYIKVNKK